MKKHKLTAFLLAVIMVLQVSGLTAFAEQELPVSDQTAVTEENNAETNPAD